jgi:MFS family permease
MSNKGWAVTAAGMGLNLALGILYAWSIFSKQLTEAIDKNGFGWSKTEATLPYTIAIACFAAMMVPAGRLQDRFGPRIVATVGAILTGTGLIVASLGTPAAVKWFPPEKKGLITGLVVAGFGLAPVYIAPLSRYLLATYGISTSFRILGCVFMISTTFFAQFIKNPSSPLPPPKKTGDGAIARSSSADQSWRQMLKTPAFYSLYLQYACAATAGLMIIGHLAKIVSVQSGNTVKIGFLFVALLAIFNAGGRVVAGIVSDYIGRIITIAFVCFLQAVIMVFFSQLSTVNAFILGSAMVGFNYGACLSLFPATTADYWGTRNLGLNYGILFTAWGVGGVLGPILAGKIADATGSYTMAYHIASGLLIFASLLAALSYISVSVNIPDKEITIKLGRRTAAEAE